MEDTTNQFVSKSKATSKGLPQINLIYLHCVFMGNAVESDSTVTSAFYF